MTAVLKPARQDARDYRYDVGAAAPAPATLDLSSLYTFGMVGQAGANDCAGLAAANLAQAWQCLWGYAPKIALNGACVYVLTKEAAGAKAADNVGTTVSGNLATLLKTGAPRDSFACSPFTDPSTDALADSAKHKITAYRNVFFHGSDAGAIDAIKSALANRYPIEFGFDVYKSWWDTGTLKWPLDPADYDGRSHACVLYPKYDADFVYMINTRGGSGLWRLPWAFIATSHCFTGYTIDGIAMADSWQGQPPPAPSPPPTKRATPVLNASASITVPPGGPTPTGLITVTYSGDANYSAVSMQLNPDGTTPTAPPPPAPGSGLLHDIAMGQSFVSGAGDKWEIVTNATPPNGQMLRNGAATGMSGDRIVETSDGKVKLHRYTGSWFQWNPPNFDQTKAP
jgi:hypothetical protein